MTRIAKSSVANYDLLVLRMFSRNSAPNRLNHLIQYYGYHVPSCSSTRRRYKRHDLTAIFFFFFFWWRDPVLHTESVTPCFLFPGAHCHFIHGALRRMGTEETRKTTYGPERAHPVSCGNTRQGIDLQAEYHRLHGRGTRYDSLINNWKSRLLEGKQQRC
ncbi:hypothetical protein BC940DRAFT_304405 [Gongronella butleri]|nr:hypothetical protein BC940DRAFT_304405 [Gongronella butleri]